MTTAPFLILSITHREEPFVTILNTKGLDGKKHTFFVEECVPRFWTEQDQGTTPKMTSIHDKPLWEVRVETPAQIRDVSKVMFPHYCADVPWAKLVRWIYGWKSVIEIDDDCLSGSRIRPVHIHPSDVDPSDFTLDILWWDIETEDCLDLENPVGRVVSIAIMDTATGIHEIGTTCPTSERMVKRFLASQEALEGVVEHTQPIEPVPMEKVKLVNFDNTDPDTNEAALLWWFHHRVKELDRDLIGGHHIKGYDVPYIRSRCKLIRKQMMSRHRGDVPVYHRVPTFRDLTDWYPLFDSKKAYNEQIRGEATTTGSGSLAWMATTELGYGKIPRTRITDLMKRDPMMLAVYNAWDNICVARCMEKLQLIPFYLLKTSFHNSTFHNAHSNMMLIEDMMGHLLMEKNQVMPSLDVARRDLKGNIEQGGFVMEAPIGVWKNAMELDNSMEYPSAIITGNLSPDTQVFKSDYPDGFPFDVNTTPAGRIYRRDREGLMPSVLRKLAEERISARVAMDEAKERGDLRAAMVWNQKQRVMKENMNSWYGVLGSGQTEKTRGRPFRLASPGIGSDITEIARLHNDWNKGVIEKTTLEFSHEGVNPGMDLPGSEKMKFQVIYQDTDSCKVVISNHDDLESKIRPFTESDISSAANILSALINKTLDDFVQQTLGVEKNEFFRIKPDALYETYFSWGVKKRYAYREFDGKQGFRGVEMRRSSSPEIVKRAQLRVFELILDGCDGLRLNQELREIRDWLDAADPILFGQPFGIKKTGTMAYKAAMWSNENLDMNFDIGDKPVLVMASSAGENPLPSNRVVAIRWGEDPSEHGLTVDREGSFQKHFVRSRSWKAILGAFNTSWEKAMAGISHSDFGEWFG